jgi:general secretion pathway protein D
LQELSEVNENGATVLVPTDTGFAPQAIDTVQSRTVSGTVVAQDGLMVAIGGLIREGVQDARAEVPVVGKLPVVGFFFRRQHTARSREELVIMIRPYVFNTPCEAASQSESLVRELSVHPNAYNGRSTLGTHCPWEAARPNPPCNPCQNTFRFHSVEPRRY